MRYISVLERQERRRRIKAALLAGENPQVIADREEVTRRMVNSIAAGTTQIRLRRRAKAGK